MFCMNCGQALPDGAKFCMKCGTPLGAVTPPETTQTECFVRNMAKVPEFTGDVQVGYSPFNASCTNNGSLLRVGDEIEFGMIKRQRVKQRINWKVLSIHDRMALIISSNVICNKPYHQPGGNNTWAFCTLRNWLNNDFIRSSFIPAEQARILPCRLNDYNNQQYRNPGGVPIIDRVFLLSLNEADQLFADDAARAIGSSWWLRSPGDSSNFAALVFHDGMINTGGGNVSSNDGIRPALWINQYF